MKSVIGPLGCLETYLDDREAKHRGSDVANPHAGKHGNEHVRDEDGARLGSSFAQNKRRHDFGDVVFGKSRCYGEASKKQHNDRRPHGGENVSGSGFRLKTFAGVIVANNAKSDGKKRYEERSDKERYRLKMLVEKISSWYFTHLRSPKQTNKDDHGQTILLLRLIHDGHYQ